LSGKGYTAGVFLDNSIVHLYKYSIITILQIVT
jgi:hypothetical protein